MPLNLAGFGVNEHISILGTNRTITAIDLMRFEAGERDCVFDSAAMAIGFVPDSSVLVGAIGRHRLGYRCRL